MPIPVNVEDLLNKCRVESDRIEFKKGWNPSSIYRSVCAFANDIDNIGGGYILVGVEEENGVAKRPVCGVPEDKIDTIHREIVGFNNLIQPHYRPRTSLERVDEKWILVFWVPSGDDRPYKVPKDITVNKKDYKIFVRSCASSVEAREAEESTLRELAKRVPFDDRGNAQIKPEDISDLRVRDYLVSVKSRLVETVKTQPLINTLDQMGLVDGPAEDRRIKNVAAMMFGEHPEVFFPYTQVEIVWFPKGRITSPDMMTVIAPIRGPVPLIIDETLRFLRTNVVKEKTIKSSSDDILGKGRAVRVVNYPMTALTEVIVNAMYHRDYAIREPVEVTIENDSILVLSHSGPDRSISDADLHLGQSFVGRKYRNRRLGDFLKELKLTEGRATGVPTIQNALAENGSPRALFKTDPDRTFFLVKIPIHPAFNETSDDEVRRIQSVLRSNLETVSDQFEDDPYFDRLRLACLKKNDLLAKQVAELVIFCRSPRSLKEIREKFSGYTVMRLKRQLISPLLILNMLKMLYPDKPTSSMQKYFTEI